MAVLPQAYVVDCKGEQEVFKKGNITIINKYFFRRYDLATNAMGFAYGVCC